MTFAPTDSKPVLADTDEDLDDLDEQEKPASSGRPRHNTRIDAPPTSMPSLGSGPSGSGSLDAADEDDEDELSAAFARELAKEMENLVSGKDASGFSNGEGQEDETQVKEAFKAVWEAMLVEGLNGAAGAEGDPVTSLGEILGETRLGVKPDGPAAAGSASQGPSDRNKNDFQERLKQAMDNMKKTESSIKADTHVKTPGGAQNTKSLETLLTSLKDTDSGENEEELAGFLEDMMGQLMSKDVLYEPLKELSENFPGYLKSPPAPIEPADKERYEKQQTCVKRILAVFDGPNYKDDSPEGKGIIVELMSEMQSYGSPPSELMGPLPPGMGLGQDGMPQLDDNCVIA
ncbi:hypothetical protein AX17_006013 [Amanita inopinata Kibby_2008]|nr:hypothetical protein AX17_006013 [Amanita inopinata Kibby_2008]